MTETDSSHRAFDRYRPGSRAKPVRTAVVCPVDELSLLGALEAERAGLIEPVFIGPGDKVSVTAYDQGLDTRTMKIIDSGESPHDAAKQAASLAGHLGLGRRLIDAAAERAARDGYEDLAVISSVGTREYYRRLGFEDGRLYQHRRLDGDR